MTVVSRNTPGVGNSALDPGDQEDADMGAAMRANRSAPFDRNVLHKFRSFNYLFTLSACPPDALNSREKIIQNADKFVIAKSAGKKINQLSSVNASGVEDEGNAVFDTLNLLNSFNNKSPGRFDLFLNNVEIDTLMSFSETTNLAMATKIRFDVFESMSINGFMEALQVSAQAAGNYTYMGAPFILKVEFLGYLDNEKGPSEKITNAGAQATRYLVINFTKIGVDLDETGTRYKCQAVPHNEMGYGDHNSLKEPIQMRGATVLEVLKNLQDSLNRASKAAVIAEATQKNNEEANLHDEYEIVFPTPDWGNGSFDYTKTWDKMKDAKIVELSDTPAVFSFPSPDQVASAYNPPEAGAGRGFINPTFDPNVVIDTRQTGAQYVFNADKVSVMFPKGAKIHDIIATVIRDSKFGRDIIDNIKNNPADLLKNHMIEYIHVAIEVEQKSKFSAKYQRPMYKYRYVVLPYKMHYSRIPFIQSKMTASEQNTLQKLYVTRKYEYLYTGKNVDVRRFNLTFNHLFYQAFPRGMGNNTAGASPDVEQAGNNKGIQLRPPARTPSQNEINSGNVTRNTPAENESAAETARLRRQANLPVVIDLPPTPRISDPRRASITGPGGNATAPTIDPYTALVKNMHQAILDNTGQIKIDIEISGDPYFFVTGGIGNYRPKLVNDTMTENGEAPYQTNETIVLLEFRNPEDIDSITGLVRFNSNRVPFSGCFKVTKVTSKFSDGSFIQTLNMIRIPGQAINDVAPESLASSPANNTRVSSAEPADKSQVSFVSEVPLSTINIPSELT
jgi:hypothetical protein